MAIGDIFKIRGFKEQINTLTLELAAEKEETNKYKSVMTDEHGQALDIKAELLNLERRHLVMVLDQVRLQKAIDEKIQERDAISKEIVELEEKKLLQDFGLYEPMYSFATSALYKEELDSVRNKQKLMIKNKTAAICSKQWSVDGNRSKGIKMTNDNIKQALLTFNTECENAIDRVTFSNYKSMATRISKSFAKINKLNEVNALYISEDFLKLKYYELALAFEYAQKKQEEKEYIREQREIQRENARVQKELEAERQRIEKEQTHYQNALRRLWEQVEAEQNAARRELLMEKIEAAQGELSDLETALQEVDYRQANERAGYVYVISNIGAFGEDVYKIGMTRRLEPLDRVDELGGASVPFKFDVHALIFSADAPKLETALHNAFAGRRLNMVNGRKEFFRVSLAEIEDVVRKNHDRTVEFNYTPIAEQYRESMKMK